MSLTKVSYSMITGAPVSILDFGVVPTLTDAATQTANSIALQNACAYAVSSGVPLQINSGNYYYSTTLVLPNGITIFGDGRINSILHYTGTSDAIQINNPINSSTAANIHLSNFGITVTTRTAGKACLADTGSTFLTFQGMGFYEADRLLILDQSELVEIDLCDFELAATSTCGIWLVNGADRTTGANQYFTNRISITRNQFNGVIGVNTKYSIIDDGGTSHNIVCNNFNGINAMRFAGVRQLVVTQNEIEVAQAFYFQTTRFNGATGGLASTGINISDNFITGNASSVQFTAGSCNSVTFRTNTFYTASGVIPIANAQTNCVDVWHGSGNVQANFGVGVTADMYIGNNENCKRVAFNSAWQSATVQPSLGNGTLESYFTRNGNIVIIDILLTAGSTTTFGTGSYYFALPSNALINELPMVGTTAFGTGVTTAGGITTTLSVSRASATLVRMLVNGTNVNEMSPTYPGTFAAGEFISIQFQYVCTSALVNP